MVTNDVNNVQTAKVPEQHKLIDDESNLLVNASFALIVLVLVGIAFLILRKKISKVR